MTPDIFESAIFLLRILKFACPQIETVNRACTESIACANLAANLSLRTLLCVFLVFFFFSLLLILSILMSQSGQKPLNVHAVRNEFNFVMSSG